MGNSFFTLILSAVFFSGSFAVGQVQALQLSSPDFAPGQAIPPKYARGNGNVAPELHISGVPTAAKSMALLVEDPDAPSGLFIHWVVWNLPADTTTIPKGTLPVGAKQGKNSSGENRYDGPSPPSGTHRYFFRLFALDTILDLPGDTDRTGLLMAMAGHVLAKADVMGTYSAGR